MSTTQWVYPIIRWNEDTKEWIADKVASNTLEEAAEVLTLLEEHYPNQEFKIGQYSINDFQYMRSFS